MKREHIIFILLALAGSNAYAQETLQTVTDRGNTTSNRISINPIYQPGSRFTAYGAGNGYFDLYNNSNSSISLALKRSDGASVFEIDGHSMNSYFGGNVGIGNPSSIWPLTVNGTITSNGNGDQRFHLRPNAGFSGCIYWAESGVAERGILGFNAGSGDLVYRSGAYDFLTGSERFRITDNGNVGIGTSAPISKLDVTGVIRYGNNGSSVGALSYGSGLITLEASSANTSIALIPSGDGNVGIGISDTKGYKLAVAGNMIAESVTVKLQNTWPDYVFAKSYQLPTLQETENHIKEKGHLSGIPSASEVKANGIDLGEMNAKLLQKIEELTLHLIHQNKKNDENLERLKNQDQKNLEQEKRIRILEERIDKN